MSRPQARAAKQIAGIIAVLGVMSPCLFSAQVAKYKKSKPEQGYLIQNVPAEKWLKRNYCGPACLAMVLNHWDEAHSFSQRQITEDIFDSANQATYNSEMVLYPRTKGFASYSFQGDLRTLKDVVGQGIPVIVLTKPIRQIPKGHYRVVIGYDDDSGQVIFHDPFFGSRHAMSFKNFLKVWELGKGRNQSRWMLAVVPRESPFPFPALQNDPLTAINLATAYYRRSDLARSRAEWEKAREALAADPYPLYSLGMIALREGKFAEAEARARQAIALDAKSAYAHDVLGLACAKQEKIELALQALERAQQLAPKEKFIRQHYLQVRALRIERARPMQIEKEKQNEKTD